MSKRIPHQYIVLAEALNRLFNGVGASATARGVMLSPRLIHAETLVGRVERVMNDESVLRDLADSLRDRILP